VQPQVLLGGQVAVEHLVLEDEADVPADVVTLGGDVEAAHASGAGGRPRERAEHVDRRALAGAVEAEEPEDLAAGDGERDAADGLDLAVAQRPPGTSVLDVFRASSEAMLREVSLPTPAASR
jgi:hypothetical protein